jgi:WD40 repeat protein
VFTGHKGLVDSVAISPDGRTLASGGKDHKVMIYSVVTNTRIAVLEGHTGQVDSVVFSPDGKTLATGAEDRSVRLWDLTR